MNDERKNEADFCECSVGGWQIDMTYERSRNNDGSIRFVADTETHFLFCEEEHYQHYVDKPTLFIVAIPHSQKFVEKLESQPHHRVVVIVNDIMRFMGITFVQETVNDEAETLVLVKDVSFKRSNIFDMFPISKAVGGKYGGET